MSDISRSFEKLRNLVRSKTYRDSANYLIKHFSHISGCDPILDAHLLVRRRCKACNRYIKPIDNSEFDSIECAMSYSMKAYVWYGYVSTEAIVVKTESTDTPNIDPL